MYINIINYIFECLSFHSFIESHVVEVEIKTGGVLRSKNFCIKLGSKVRLACVGLHVITNY